MKNKLLSFSAFCKSITIFSFALLFNVGVINGQTELASNGDFETGDTTGWLLFQNGGSAALDNTLSNGGTWSGRLQTGGPSNPAFKQEAIGAGIVSAGDEVTISFDLIGSVVQPGAVFNVLLFGEGAGGASFTHIFNPAPTLTAAWTTFTGTYTIAPGTDVSNGISFLIEAVCGGDAGCSVTANIDNVSVSVPDSGPSARVQVIHNSPDAIASEVDVYLNGELALDNFAFRTATPFINVPAGTEISVAVAPSNSTSVADAVATFPYTLTEGETYVLVASGIVSPTGYSPATPFDIAVYALGQESAGTTGNTDVLVYHGVTDAPTVDVNEVTGPSVLVNDISYGEFNGYLELPTADYSINVSTADGSTVVESYDAPLATLGLDDEAIVVVASGFLDPSVNSNGPAFGLWVALPSGGALVELPITGTTITDPTDGPVNNGSTGTDFYIYSELSGNENFSDFEGFNLVDFAGGGILISQPNLNGDTVLKVENLNFFGSGFGLNFNATSTYTYVHLNYYATTSTQFSFSLVDDSLSSTICCGNPQEPFYTFGPDGDEPLVAGSWQSVFIPLSHFANFPALVDGTWDGTDLKQTLITGNGTIYFDNIYFSTTNTLSTSSFALEEMTIAPNPTNSEWNIKTVSQTITNITVFDILGKQVIKMSPNSAEAVIDASNLKDGLYLAKISTENGSQTVKLIKN